MSTTLALPRVATPQPISADGMIAATGAAIIGLWFSATTPEGLHWFVLPVTLCGALVGGDAIRWVRGKLGAFDPAGVLALLGVHFFFMAPLLHVRWDYWMRYVQAPPDWRDWLGAMAILNCVGLVAYRAGRAWGGRIPRLFRGERRLDARRVAILLPLMLLITAIAQYWVYSQFGGLLGYVQAYEQPGKSFQGLGVVFLISESFPILALIGYAFLCTRHPKLSSWWLVALVMVVYFGLKIVFGGLRGSRGNTVWGMFWALGIVHLWIRPLPRRTILAGIPLLAAFMFGYGLYKAAGLHGLTALTEPRRAAELAMRSGRTFPATLLGDLGRSDVQAYVLYRVQGASAHELAWGRTYLGGAAIVVPRWLAPDRPPTKMKEGTDITYGRGTYDAGRLSTRIYGLAGEAMLNFGVVGVPVVFLLWGLLVGLIRRAYYGLKRHDARVLLLPLLVNLALLMLVSDSDNMVFFLVKQGALPALVLMLCARRVRPAERTA